MFRRFVQPFQPAIQWDPGVFLRIKRLELDVDHSLPRSAEFKSEWSYTWASLMRLHEVHILPFTDQLEFNINKMHRPVTNCMAQLMLQALLLSFSRTWSMVTAVLYVRNLCISWFGCKSPARLMCTSLNECTQTHVTIWCTKRDSFLWVRQCGESDAGRVYSCLVAL